MRTVTTANRSQPLSNIFANGAHRKNRKIMKNMKDFPLQQKKLKNKFKFI